MPGMAIGENERKSKNFLPTTRLRRTIHEIVAASRTMINDEEMPTKRVL